jgi:hypothetical protein
LDEELESNGSRGRAVGIRRHGAGADGISMARAGGFARGGGEALLSADGDAAHAADADAGFDQGQQGRRPQHQRLRRGQAVIPIGAPVVGEVARFQRNGHVGKKGKIEIRLLYAETPSGQVRLTGNSYDEGVSGTAASVATMVLLSPLGGYLIHGTSAKIEAGAAVQAYLAEPLRFTWFPESGEKVALLPARPDVHDAARPGFSALD